MIVPWRSPRILSLNVLLVGWKFWVGLQVQSNNNWQHLLAVFAWWYVKNTLLPNYFNQLFCFLVAIWVRIQSFLSLEKKEKKKTWPVYYTDGLEWSPALLRCILNITKLFVVKFVDVWCLLFSDLKWFVWVGLESKKCVAHFWKRSEWSEAINAIYWLYSTHQSCVCECLLVFVASFSPICSG